MALSALFLATPKSRPPHCCPEACSSLMVFPLSIQDGLQSSHVNTEYPSWRRKGRNTEQPHGGERWEAQPELRVRLKGKQLM